MTGRAFCRMVEARVYVSRRLVLVACLFAVLLALAQPAGVTAPLFGCSLLGIIIALDQTPGRHPHLDRCEQSAPLFGRELGRTKALAACAAALFTTILFAAAQLARGSHDAVATLEVVPAAVVACTLTALSATVRRGWTRAFYVLLSCATAAAAYAFAVAAGSVLGELTFCAVVAFLALRQYGETLARYDPV